MDKSHDTIDGWHIESCHKCMGSGMQLHYSAYDFEGASECDGCYGNGIIWVSPKGRHALYPGGPFVKG